MAGRAQLGGSALAGLGVDVGDDQARACAASADAVARPMPDAAPVTTASCLGSLMLAPWWAPRFVEEGGRRGGGFRGSDTGAAWRRSRRRSPRPASAAASSECSVCSRPACSAALGQHARPAPAPSDCSASGAAPTHCTRPSCSACSPGQRRRRGSAAAPGRGRASVSGAACRHPRREQAQSRFGRTDARLVRDDAPVAGQRQLEAAAQRGKPPSSASVRRGQLLEPRADRAGMVCTVASMRSASSDVATLARISARSAPAQNALTRCADAAPRCSVALGLDQGCIQPLPAIRRRWR